MNKIIIGDADSLVALADNHDANYKKAAQISQGFISQGFRVIYPNTAILEAITALSRAKNLPEKAKLINKQYLLGAFSVEYINSEIQTKAAEIFKTKSQSKKNTIFDAVVADTAKQLEADFIFSFDDWYPKLGFKLAGE